MQITRSLKSTNNLVAMGPLESSILQYIRNTLDRFVVKKHFLAFLMCYGTIGVPSSNFPL